jgi:hypothetical protein
MCFECDTVWTAISEIGDAKGANFEDFMKGHSSVPNWKVIKRIKEVDDPGE